MQVDIGSKRAYFGKIGYLLLSIMFLLCVIVQVFFAGLAIFVNPVNWVKHISFIHIFEFIPILMVITALFGKMPRSAIWQGAGLFGLIFIMYFTANISPVLPLAAAAHPVIAIGLFWMSILVVQRGWALVRTKY